MNHRLLVFPQLVREGSEEVLCGIKSIWIIVKEEKCNRIPFFFVFS